MITYHIVRPNQIKNGLLDGYQRYTETKRVKYLTDGVLQEKEDHFIDAWDATQLHSIEKYMKEAQNITILAKQNRQVIGFVVLDLRIFDDYMNMPYIHTDNRFRGNGIGTNLMLLTSKIAKDNGAKKLYISAHPAIEAQAFYEKIGCVLAEEINQVLYDLEPFDIQLERALDYTDIMMRQVNHEFSQYSHLSSTMLNKLLPNIYRVMPASDLDYIKTVQTLLMSDERSYFSMGTLLLKKRTSVIDEKYLDLYEDTLLHYVHDWDQVDQYCYRVLGPIFNRNYKLFHILKKWSTSENKDVRRASLVSMLTSSKKITITYPIEHIMVLVNALKNDQDIHVKKAVGWVLKCAYVTYPKDVLSFLNKYHKTLDRIIFRYALEHMEKELKASLMKR